MCDCDNCPLKDAVYVPTSGPENADIIFVVESPGKTEETTQIPLTGRAGQELDKILEEIELDRSLIRVINTCNCHSTKNGKDAPPPDTAIECCSKRLNAEIRFADPKIVVAFGKTATKALTGLDRAVRDTCGNAYPWKVNPNIKILCTYHPSAMLHRDRNKIYDQIKEDLLKTKC